MSNPVIVRDVLARGSIRSVFPAAILPEQSKQPNSVRKAAWIVLIASGVLAILPIGRSVLVNLEVWTLTQADNARVRKQLAGPGTAFGSADYFEAIAELALQPATENLNAARTAARAAVKVDPSRPHAWAMLAYLESKSAGTVVPIALDALARSMTACPFCDHDLVRWRFNFVLANWDAIPEETRSQAFDQADILRWTGQNDEFLAEMRAKALGAGIPFDEYRAAVDTPVRTLDLPEVIAGGPRQPKT